VGRPERSAFMDEAEDDVLACVSFPVDHWAKIHSINGLERLNGEIILGALICVKSVGAFKLMHRKTNSNEAVTL
jgi:transposase-like protein